MKACKSMQWLGMMAREDHLSGGDVSGDVARDSMQWSMMARETWLGTWLVTMMAREDHLSGSRSRRLKRYGLMW